MKVPTETEGGCPVAKTGGQDASRGPDAWGKGPLCLALLDGVLEVGERLFLVEDPLSQITDLPVHLGHEVLHTLLAFLYQDGGGNCLGGAPQTQDDI